MKKLAGGFPQKKTAFSDRERVASVMRLAGLLNQLEQEARSADLSLTAHLIAVANESLLESLEVPAGRRVGAAARSLLDSREND